MFRFKQFEIDDSACAQKIGTDGVLLGAWAPLPKSVNYILDIGTGSGLLALMLAQRTNIGYSIDAIDIDNNAVTQAEINFKNSPWRSKLHIHHASLQQFNPTFNYDVIVSNPPFFDKALKSMQHDRNLARHNDCLSLHDLFFHVSTMLNKNGIFSMIYPYNRKEETLQAARQNNLYPFTITNIKGHETTPYKRVLLAFVKNSAEVKFIEEELIIEQSRNCYTDSYKKLTQDFYLKF